MRGGLAMKRTTAIILMLIVVIIALGGALVYEVSKDDWNIIVTPNEENTQVEVKSQIQIDNSGSDKNLPIKEFLLQSIQFTIEENPVGALEKLLKLSPEQKQQILNLAENEFSGFVEIVTSKELEGFEKVSV